MRSRTALVAAAALVGALPAAGCTSERERYCGALAEEQPAVRALGRPGAGSGGSVTAAVAVFERLRAEAPGDLADEWDTFLAAWQALEQALAAAGVDEQALAGGRRPPGVSRAEQEAIADAAVQLRSLPVVQAAASIEQHARDVCGLELSTGGP